MFHRHTKKPKPVAEEESAYCYFPVRELCHSEELGLYVTYGLHACRRTERGLRAVAYISDVCVDEQAARRLAETCTQGNLDPLHLEDVIEDFLAY